MTRAALGGMIVALVTSPAAIAQAQRLTEPPARARAVVGVEMGGTSAFDQSSTPDRAHIPIRFGLAIAGEYHLAHRWWVAGTFGVSQWVDGDSVEAGYLYRRLDLGVAPRFEVLRWPGWLVTTTLDLALPIGLSKPSVTVPQRRAFGRASRQRVGMVRGRHGGRDGDVPRLEEPHRAVDWRPRRRRLCAPRERPANDLHAHRPRAGAGRRGHRRRRSRRAGHRRLRDVVLTASRR